MGGTSSSNVVTIIQEVVNNVVTNVLNRNSISLQNLNVNTQIVKINIGPKAVVNCKKGFNVNQRIKANMKVTNTVSLQATTNIKNSIQNELKAQVDQIMSGAYEMLGGLGTFNSQRNSTYLRQAMITYIETNITNEFIVSVCNSIYNNQTAEINIYGTLNSEEDCTISQETIVDMQAQAMVDSIINNALTNVSINRAAAIIKQDNKVEMKGLNSLFDSFFKVIIVGIICFTIFMVAALKYGGAEVIRAVGSPKFLITIAALIALYFILAFFLKFGPFKKAPAPQYWGCQMDGNGFNTGQCMQYDNPVQGPYRSKEECMATSNVTCPRFFGCEKSGGSFTGNCVQYGNPGLGPYQDQTSCQDDIRANRNCCNNCYMCLTDGNQCLKIGDPLNYPNADDPDIYPDQASCDSACNYKPPKK
jgi:hypothetical protein